MTHALAGNITLQKKWIRWRLLDGKRPVDLPTKVPDEWQKAYAWFVPWARWDLHGRQTTRPPQAPAKIPKWAQEIEAQPLIIAKIKKLGPFKPATVKIPNWGAIVPGGASLLDHDMTHLTDGLKWPAVDAGWETGKPVLAHADCEVYDNTSSSQGGNAFYIIDEYDCKHWVAHITKVPKLNKSFSKGDEMTNISSDHDRPHVHWATDTTALIKKQLLYGKTGKGPQYTHCPWTVRDQFEDLLGV